MSFASIFAKEFSRAIVDKPKKRNISNNDQKIVDIVFWIFVLISLFVIIN